MDATDFLTDFSIAFYPFLIFKRIYIHENMITSVYKSFDLLQTDFLLVESVGSIGFVPKCTCAPKCPNLRQLQAEYLIASPWKCVWLQNLREFLAFKSLPAEVENLGIIPIQRQSDSFFKDQLLASGKFAKHEIKEINYCQLFLDVQLFSDITSACG